MVPLSLIMINESVINVAPFVTMPYNCNYTALTVAILIR